jgi:hypothetical protein
MWPGWLEGKPPPTLGEDQVELDIPFPLLSTSSSYTIRASPNPKGQFGPVRLF